MLQFLQRLKETFRPPLGQIAADRGRIAEVESVFRDDNPDLTVQSGGYEYFARVAEDALIWGALDYRDVSRIWVSAAEIKDTNPLTGAEYTKHPGQLITPPAVSQEIQRFLEWNIDDRLDRPLETILQSCQLAYLIYGFVAVELIWRNEDTPHGARTVLADMQEIDPQRILIKRVWQDGTPVSEEQQSKYRLKDYSRLAFFLKRWYSNNEDLIEFPDYKIALITNKGVFGNPYGQSELKPLVKPEDSARKIQLFWDRHLERHGSPQMIHYYSASKEGSQWDAWRQQQLATLQRMQNQSIIQISENGKLEALKGEGETQSFKDRLEALERRVSIVLCGSATALQEGKTGARAKEEATTVRQKSAKEQYDCSLLEAMFNYWVIPPLVDFNFGRQDVYPYIQMIPPQSITPTTPEGQPQLQAGATGEGTPDETKGDDAGPEEQQGETPKEDAKKPQEFVDQPVEKAEKSKVSGFPDKRKPAKILRDPAVQAVAREAVSGLRVVTRKEFDTLTPAEKKTAFTITLMRGNEDLIGDLFQAMLNTLNEPNEAKAFKSFLTAIRPITQGRLIPDIELMPSFRYVRDKAYNLAILATAQSRADTYALQYVTKDDRAVRWNHRAMHGVIQAVDSPFWMEAGWLPPNGFGCRCTLKIITQAMHMSWPDKYTITDYDEDITPDEGWA